MDSKKNINFESKIEDEEISRDKTKPTAVMQSVLQLKDHESSFNLQDHNPENKDQCPVNASEIKNSPMTIPNSPIRISRCTRILMFMWITTINLMVNMDHGTIPAATNEIEKDLQIVTSELGLFGSLVYIGNLIGAIVAILIINKVNRKLLLFICLVLNGGALFAFTATPNVGFLYFDRVLVGSCQAFITIYCPVWVDQFGPRTMKAVMMAIVQIASPVGVVVGYTITTTIKETNKWTFSYIIQAILFGVFAISIIFIPINYLSITLHCINPSDPDKIKGKKKNESEKALKSGTDEAEKKKIKEKESDIISEFNHIKEEDNQAKFFWKSLCYLIRVKLFMICVASLSCLMFISTGIQYWTTNYLTNDLKFDQTVIFVAFVVTSLSAPTAGILVGGVVVQKFGGYETKYAPLICTLFGIGAVISGAPIPFVSSVPAFTATLWIFLFFGGCVVPNEFGIIISCVPDDMKAAANSVTNFLINLAGFIPAPFIYGLIYDGTKQNVKEGDGTQQTGNNFAYGFLIYYSIISVILIMVATCIRYAQFNEKMRKAQTEEILQQEADLARDKFIPGDASNLSKTPAGMENVSNLKIDLVECEKEIELDKIECISLRNPANKDKISQEVVSKFNSAPGKGEKKIDEDSENAKLKNHISISRKKLGDPQKATQKIVICDSLPNNGINNRIDQEDSQRESFKKCVSLESKQLTDLDIPPENK